MPKRAGKESLTLSQESLAKAVHNMCWSGCWSYFAFSLLTVFIIRLEIRAVIREYVSTRIKRYIINIVWRIVLYNKYNKSVHQYKKNHNANQSGDVFIFCVLPVLPYQTQAHPWSCTGKITTSH